VQARDLHLTLVPPWNEEHLPTRNRRAIVPRRARFSRVLAGV
jgi:hypothetical protein